MMKTKVFPTIMITVIFTAMLMVVGLAYTYHDVNAKIFLKKSSNYCNGDFCQSDTCIGNQCHTSTSNSTNIHHHGQLNTSSPTSSHTNSTNNISGISSVLHKHKHIQSLMYSLEKL
jgi:hypothetical protein